jgi:hypothetical protein
MLSPGCADRYTARTSLSGLVCPRAKSCEYKPLNATSSCPAQLPHHRPGPTLTLGGLDFQDLNDVGLPVLTGRPGSAAEALVGAPGGGLTPGERRVTELVASGLSNQQVAAQNAPRTAWSVTRKPRKPPGPAPDKPSACVGLKMRQPQGNTRDTLTLGLPDHSV